MFCTPLEADVIPTPDRDSKRFVKGVWYLNYRCHSKCWCMMQNANISHYSDVIMGTMASHITGLTIVYSTIYSGADQENIKAPRHWPLRGLHRWLGYSPHKWPVTRKMFSFDDVIELMFPPNYGTSKAQQLSFADVFQGRKAAGVSLTICTHGDDLSCSVFRPNIWWIISHSGSITGTLGLYIYNVLNDVATVCNYTKKYIFPAFELYPIT